VRGAAAALAIGALLSAGCGPGKATDTDQIKATITTYYKAFGSGDSQTACNQLTTDAVKTLEAAGGGKDCAELLDLALKRPAYARIAPKLEKVKVGAVQFDFKRRNASAVADVPGAGADGRDIRTSVPLKKEEGDWKIVSAASAK
jgi:ketosteroid isomerase-like protein